MLYLFLRQQKFTRYRSRSYPDVRDMIFIVYTAATIKKQLSNLMEQEHVDTEDKALEYVARMADGSMRDALSLLDQCIAFYSVRN